MATPFKCSRCPKRDTRRCRLRFSPWPRSSSGSTLSCKLSPRISARRDSSLRRLRRSVRTWYAAKSRDTTATLTIKGRTIFRVVRIMTPQLRRASPVAPGLGRGEYAVILFSIRLRGTSIGKNPGTRCDHYVQREVIPAIRAVLYHRLRSDGQLTVHFCRVVHKELQRLLGLVFFDNFHCECGVSHRRDPPRYRLVLCRRSGA